MSGAYRKFEIPPRPLATVATPATVATVSPQTVATVATVAGVHLPNLRWQAPPGLPAEWREGLTALDADKPPSVIEAGAWAGLVLAARRFVDDSHAPRAMALGWSAVDCFGLHPGAPLARHDVRGFALFVRPADVVVSMNTTGGIIRRGATGTRHSWRRAQGGAAPLWELR